MTAYYNEFDPKAAAWLRELIKQGLIADGEVDERSILEVQPEDLTDFTQCHFFAGIGGWSYALRLAGWPDDRPVWTGSPPCQPFSSAGQRKGKEDERHLAPHFAHLVDAGRPPILFGEQVASAAVFGKVARKAGGTVEGAPEWAWFDDLQDRLEAAHYAVGVSDIPAAGVGAPHIRQRTFFGGVWLDNPASARHFGSVEGPEGNSWDETRVRVSGAGCGEDRPDRPCPTNGFWRDADWLFCRDGNWRPAIPSFIEVAYGLSDRMVLCCGNSSTNNDEEKRLVNGSFSKTSADEKLPILHDGDDTEKVWRASGGQIGVPAEGLLQQSMHGKSYGKRQVPECKSQPNEVGQNSGGDVYGLRGDEKPSRPSQGRRPFQQQPVELADLVSKLPQEITLAKLYGRGSAAIAMQALQSALHEIGVMCYTPKQAEEAWESLGEEGKNRIRMGFENSFVKVVFHPLSKNEPARVVRLRGYGNAIVPQAAAAFVESFCAALEEE